MKTPLCIIAAAALLCGCSKQQNYDLQISALNARLDSFSNEIVSLKSLQSNQLAFVDFKSASNYSNCVFENEGTCYIKIGGTGYPVADKIWTSYQLEYVQLEEVTNLFELHSNFDQLLKTVLSK